MYTYQMDPTRTVGTTERTRSAGRTDGWTDGRTDSQTDGRTEWNQQLRCVGCIIKRLLPIHTGNVLLKFGVDIQSQIKLDMSTARWHLKSPQSLSGTSAHPTMVTLVNIMVMNGWLTSFSFHVNQRSHSWDKAISDLSWNFISRVKLMGVVKRARSYNQYHINSLRFHFTSIRPTIPEKELFRN